MNNKRSNWVKVWNRKGGNIDTENTCSSAGTWNMNHKLGLDLLLTTRAMLLPKNDRSHYKCFIFLSFSNHKVQSWLFFFHYCYCINKLSYDFGLNFLLNLRSYCLPHVVLYTSFKLSSSWETDQNRVKTTKVPKMCLRKALYSKF